MCCFSERNQCFHICKFPRNQVSSIMSGNKNMVVVTLSVTMAFQVKNQRRCPKETWSFFTTNGGKSGGRVGRRESESYRERNRQSAWMCVCAQIHVQCDLSVSATLCVGVCVCMHAHVCVTVCVCKRIKPTTIIKCGNWLSSELTNQPSQKSNDKLWSRNNTDLLSSPLSLFLPLYFMIYFPA